MRRIAIPSRALPIRGGGAMVPLGVDPGPDTVQLDPFLFPPPGATTINVAANVALPGAGRFDAGVTYRVPIASYGVISSIDLLLDSILINTSVLWTLLINGKPVPGFGPITILGRNGAASVSKTWQGPLRIVMPLNGTVSATIQNVDGGVYTAGTALYGWFFPQDRATKKR